MEGFSSTSESSVGNKSEVMKAWKGGMGLMVARRVMMLEISLILLTSVSASPYASSDQIMPAHITQPESCIEQCMRDCKSSGIGVAACIKYCPVHCLPPDTSSRKAHYCNLGCMLDQCAKFTDGMYTTISFFSSPFLISDKHIY